MVAIIDSDVVIVCRDQVEKKLVDSQGHIPNI